MSTLRSLPRLRRLPLGIYLAALGCLLAGCQSTTTPRTGAASRLKTFLAVGDKPLPVVSGEPGSSVAAAEPEVAPQVKTRSGQSDARISGRVYDAQGAPVPDARVRLAVSGAAGGKDVSTLTDRSGAFTLRGVRPGSSYTVIAEYESVDGPQSGRVTARTSETGVEISLAPGGGRAAVKAPGSRVNRVSDRDAVDDAVDEPLPGSIRTGLGRDASASDQESEDLPARTRPRARLNEEDLPPPEAETLVPERSRTARYADTGADAPWRRGDTGTPVPRGEVADSEGDVSARHETARAPLDPETRGTSTLPSGAAEGTPLDEGPNPLPPALERVGDRAAARESEPTAGTGPLEGDGRRVAAASRSGFDSPSRPSLLPAELSPTPTDTAPGARVVVPETFAPVVLDHEPSEDAPKTRPKPRRPTPRPSPSAWSPEADEGAFLAPAIDPFASQTVVAEAATAATTAPAPAPAELPPGPAPAPLPEAKLAPASRLAAAPVLAPTPARRQPTWGEIAAAAKEIPPLEGGEPKPPASRVARDDRPAPEPVALALAAPRVVRTAEPVKSQDKVKTVKTAAASSSPGGSQPLCDYDERHRRVQDFRIPDLDGKPVRFQELDADLVLLDFWGTWCQPCLRSIPHLVDLQSRVGGKKLVVVGIACEQDAPEQAAKRVAATARQLRVNYPILLSRNDGSCPLQEALHIQAFPTMILVDRQGRVLWRDQGATTATLARLDQFIAATSKEGIARR